MQDFHPLTAAWFAGRFEDATEPQRGAWPEVRAGRDVLISAPTGSGKTLAAFLICLDRLVARGIDVGSLDDQTEVVYVSPLKALSTDINRTLEARGSSGRDRWPRDRTRHRAAPDSHRRPHR